jgi:hypothetical protein
MATNHNAEHMHIKTIRDAMLLRFCFYGKFSRFLDTGNILQV